MFSTLPMMENGMVADALTCQLAPVPFTYGRLGRQGAYNENESRFRPLIVTLTARWLAH